MLTLIVSFLIVYTVWLLLSGFFAPLFFALGAVATLVALFVAVRMRTKEDDYYPLAYVAKAPLYWLWLIKEIILSSLTVTAKVWQPKLSLEPGFAWIPTSQQNSIGMTSFANSITLTPGTVSVIVRGNQIGVHALDASSLEELREGTMDRRVAALSKRGKS